MRVVATAEDKIRKKAIEQLQYLEEMEVHRITIHLICVCVNKHVAPQVTYTIDTKCVVLLVCNFLDIHHDTSSDDTGVVSAMIEADSGEIDYTRSDTLLDSVSSAQQA